MINTDPNHIHNYDPQGKIICCSQTEKVYHNANADELIHGDAIAKQQPESKTRKLILQYWPATVSFTLLLIGILLDNFSKQDFFIGIPRLVLYILAYLPVALPVIKDGIKAIGKGEIFTEFTLMVIATLGAFVLKEYPEAVAVMLFYAVGELFQSAAVSRAKRNIKALLDVRPDKATVIRGEKIMEVPPDTVLVNEIIQVKVGEKVSLDGTLLSENASFNTAALTGESSPQTIAKGQAVLAGMINLEKVIEVKVNKPFNESSISKILNLVQNANSKKAQTELFIRKFSRIYTPAVVFLAVGVCLLPYFFVSEYVFSDWLYRALIFLVISCPCALVISIPLGYFGGIGAASRKGILMKGSNYLDLLTNVNTVVMDKTGTLTKGVFKVQEVKSVSMTADAFIRTVAAVESLSTHPIAKAIVEHAKGNIAASANAEEISGHGLKAEVNGKTVLAGNTKLLKKFNIEYPSEVDQIVDTIVVVAIENKYVGYITITDELKEDAKTTIEALHQLNIKTVMLSGDKQAVVDKVAKALNIDSAYGSLLPENKVEKVETLKTDKSRVIAFIGDGINDAPVLALSDVGIAMGGLGSDAAIETADVVIQTDQPSKIITAIKIGKATKRIVWQNISFAFGVKLIVLALGAGGIATMWEAVFADVGVALLAVLNAVRIQQKKF